MVTRTHAQTHTHTHTHTYIMHPWSRKQEMDKLLWTLTDMLLMVKHQLCNNNSKKKNLNNFWGSSEVKLIMALIIFI